MITCPDGLVFNQKTGICTWPDEAQKKGCSSEGNGFGRCIYSIISRKTLTIYSKFLDVFQFTCPKVTEEVGATHPRYADPDDCQYFYVCINGETPRRNGCKLGQAFDDTTKRCDWARKIPEWYATYL